MWKAGKKIRMARKAEAESKRQVSSAASSSTATTPSPSKVRSPTKSRSSRSPSYSSSASPSAGRALSFARASPNSTSASPHMHKYMQNSSNSNTPASSNSNTNTSTASSRVSNKFYSSPTLSPAYGPSSASPQSPDFTGFDNDDMISAGIAAARTSLVHRSSDMRDSSTGNYSSSMVFDKLNLDEGMHAHVSAHVNVHGAPDDTGAPSGPAQPVHSISMRDRHGSNESYDSVSSSSRGSSFTNGVGLTGLTGMSGMSGMGIMGGMVGMNSMGMRKDGVSDDALEQAMKNEWGGNYQGSVLMNRKYEKRSQHPNGGNGVTAGNKDYDDSKFRKPPSRRVI